MGFEQTNFQICSDPDRIQQVLLNLLSNAIKFTPKGEVAIMCRLVLDEDSKKYMLKIIVRDTGVGISEKDQKNLFKLFGTMQHSGQQNSNGIGLGLVISRSIVTAYEGIIDFESERDVGTKFFFTFMIDNSQIEIEQSNIEPQVPSLELVRFDELLDQQILGDQEDEKKGF